MRAKHSALLVAAGAFACVATGFGVRLGHASAGPGRALPARFQRSPYSLMSLSIGSPNDGWQLRADKLEETRFLRLRRASQKLSYGHPALIRMLTRSAEDLAITYPGSVLLVGDVSALSGGPLLGHRSHQSGRDADVGFLVKDAAGKPVDLERFVAFDGDGRARAYPGLFFDEARNWALLSSWLRDQRARVTNVFVSAPLRERLLAYGRSKGTRREVVSALARLMNQPKSVSLHDDHFHVRIACPAGHVGICEAESRVRFAQPTKAPVQRSERRLAEVTSPPPRAP